LPRFHEPKEGVDGVVLLYRRKCFWRQGDVACELLLSGKDGGACAF
jgi:hypothetical protein